MNDKPYLNSENGKGFTEMMLPVLMGHIQHHDWLARKSAIQGVMMLVRQTVDKESLVNYKPDMLSLLNPQKADKYRPVREATAECL